MRFSLIMPVYNAEATLPRALQSIASQSCRDLEVVFVDDCCTDSSPALMEGFQKNSGLSITIVRQSENRGVAAARNRGLEAAQGDYIGFVDADDTLEPQALEKASEALDGHDILGWDWILGFEKNGRVMRQADYDNPLQAVKNLMGGTMRWNLWLFLIRRDFLQSHDIRFIDGANMGEDMQFMIKSFCKAKHVVQLHEPLYRYNAVSETSLSRQFSDRRRAEIETNLAAVETAIRDSAYAEILEPAILQLKLYLKRPLLISDDRRNYELWYNWWHEANIVATTNKALPAHTRILQGMAAHRCWMGVKLYYRLIHQFVYGILYR